MTRRLFQDSAMMQNTSHVAVRHIRIDSAFFHDFQVVQREKATVRTHLSRLLTTRALHPVDHRHQQPVVVQFPTDLLRYDQMIVAHRQRRCVAQRESPAVRQKAAVRVGTRKLPHSGLLQPLQPHGNLTKLPCELFHRGARHLQPGSFIRIFACALLLPPPNVLADLGAFRAQLLQGLRGARRRVRRNARGIDGYVPQLPQPQRARQLHHLREDVVHRSPVALAKLVQRPKIRLRPSRQIAKRQIFPNALLQPPRTGHPQGVGVQPHLQPQRWMIGRMPFVAIARFKFLQIQLLHRAMHEKTKMPLSQDFSHCRWQQVSLLRVVLQKIGHPALLLSRQYRGSVKPSCHTDSCTLSSPKSSQCSPCLCGKSIAFILLPPLLPLRKSQFLCNQANPVSFLPRARAAKGRKRPGWGVSALQSPASNLQIPQRRPTLTHESSPSTFVLRGLESILYPQSYCSWAPLPDTLLLRPGGFSLNGSERRTTQRFQMRLPLTVRWTTGAAVGETSTESRDVSSRGVYFFLAKDVKEGSPVEILLTLPNEITLAGPVRVRCLGRVQRTEPREEGAVGVVAAIERYEFLRGEEDK